MAFGSNGQSQISLLATASVCIVAFRCSATVGASGMINTKRRLLAAILCSAGLATPLSAQGLSAPGVVVAKQEARLASPISALVTMADLDVGDTFEAGDVLINFDCRIVTAEHEAAKAQANAAYAQFKTNKELNGYGALGSTELAASRAQSHAASATAKSIGVRTKFCEIAAPFTGRVASRNINSHEIAIEGVELYYIVNHTNLAVELIVPSDWLGWLTLGAPFTFHVQETGRVLDMTVNRIGAVVDPVSRTISVEGVFADTPTVILPGMSGLADFPAN